MLGIGICSMKLSNLTEGRDNNFNLIRIIAALAVLVDHSFALAVGTADARPFLKYSSLNISFLAVDVFFVTSGFLVTASLLKRQNIMEFVLARVLRIYPALLVMQFLVVFGLGLFFTTAGRTSYLVSSDTLVYWIKGSTLVTGLATTLPGVFERNPFKNSVNGSLWTMPYEIGMYTILVGMWAVLYLVPRVRYTAFKVMIVGCFTVATLLLLFSHMYMIQEDKFLRLFVMFFSGAVGFALADCVVLSRVAFWSMIAVVPSLFILGELVFFAAYVLALPYVLLYIAYIPSGLVRKYNFLGDYSYGVYIYGWPVQQSIVSLIPGVSVLALMLISAGVTIVLAGLSWHLIEQRVLQLKCRAVGYARSLCSAPF